MIWYVLIAFFSGFFIGKFTNTQWIGRYKIVFGLTMLLLFSLGLEIGADDELFKKIDTIFLYGLLIALFTSLGSFLIAYIFERIGKGK
ncbi:MAG: LysO family transporter [Fervidobacterium sp.]|jgi:uncharacterized membrane protein YbjE (DUF340 family)